MIDDDSGWANKFSNVDLANCFFAINKKIRASVSCFLHAHNAFKHLCHRDLLILSTEIIILCQKQHAMALLQTYKTHRRSVFWHRPPVIWFDFTNSVPFSPALAHRDNSKIRLLLLLLCHHNVCKGTRGHLIHPCVLRVPAIQKVHHFYSIVNCSHRNRKF